MHNDFSGSKKCEIHKALGSFMAVKVKAGSTLLLKFYPVGWKIGLFASIIGLAAFILLLIKDKKLTFSQKTYKIADKALPVHIKIASKIIASVRLPKYSASSLS